MFVACGNNYTYIFGAQCGYDTNRISYYNIIVSSVWPTKSLPNMYGFYSMSRTGSASSNTYIGNSLYGFSQQSSSTTTTAASSNITAPLTIFQGQSLNNASWYLPTTTMSFVAVHSGLTKSETECLYNSVQKLRMSLGGGYV